MSFNKAFSRPANWLRKFYWHLRAGSYLCINGEINDYIFPRGKNASTPPNKFFAFSARELSASTDGANCISAVEH
jgi:hypothetical protein